MLIYPRVLAVNFGRPPSITSTFGVTLPSNLEDEYITDGGYLEQQFHVRPKTAIFIQSIEFCNIMKDVLHTLYSIPSDRNSHQRGNPSTSREFKDAVSLDKRLVDWLHGMPSYLRVGISDGMLDFQRARNILLAR